MTVTGTATDTGGGVVAGVEVSTDGGSTWHPAELTTAAAATVSWTYDWAAHGDPTTTIESRAVDDSGNLQTGPSIASAAKTVNVSCPCSIWGQGYVPPAEVEAEKTSVNLGVKFTSEVAGEVTGLRYYKEAGATGTHVGSLWTSTGTLLAQATFSGESSSGWQTVTFSTPVAIAANTTYVASYLAPKGDYAETGFYFFKPAADVTNFLSSPPLHAVQATDTSTNGVYAYNSTSAFPTNVYNDTNYWVDPVFVPTGPPGQVTGVTATAGTGSATVSWSAPVGGGHGDRICDHPYIGSTAQTPTTTVTGSPPATTTTISGLKAGSEYTFTVKAVNSSGPGPVSSASTPAVVPSSPTVPSPPTAVTASPASSEALVSWTAPTNTGGSAITGYTVTPYIGSTAETPVPESASSTSATITGLSNGSAYTFTVTATNGIGTGAASSASTTVTPQDTILNFRNAEHRRLRRRELGRARGQIQLLGERLGHRHPLLQGLDEHRHPHRKPLVLDGDAARVGDVHQRNRLRLAVRELQLPCCDHRRHHIRRRLLRAERALLGNRKGLQDLHRNSAPDRACDK